MELLHGAHVASDLAAVCGANGALGLFGLAAALFSAGLDGSFAHCAPMCGPFVLMQLAEPAQGLMLRRCAAGALPGYQLGRLTTYVALGAVLGGIGGSLDALGRFHTLIAALLLVAALSFLLQAVRLVLPGQAAPLLPGFGGWIARALARLLRARRHIALGGYSLGLVLGLLPCGFLYAALLAAAATGTAMAGAVAMAGFALGTAPALACVGLLGAGAAARWRGFATRLAAPVFLVNAVLLAGLAARLVA